MIELVSPGIVVRGEEVWSPRTSNIAEFETQVCPLTFIPIKHQTSYIERKDTTSSQYPVYAEILTTK